MDGSKDRNGNQEKGRDRLDKLKDRIEGLEILIHNDWSDQ
jgi:hypothetical protein